MKRSTQAKRDAKELFRQCHVEGILNEERVRQILVQLSGSTNRNRFKILSELHRLIRLELTRRTARIESVLPLSTEMQHSVQERLAQRYGPGLTISFSTNAALIGGMKIQVGSDVFDSSVKARLDALEARF